MLLLCSDGLSNMLEDQEICLKRYTEGSATNVASAF